MQLLQNLVSGIFGAAGTCVVSGLILSVSGCSHNTIADCSGDCGVRENLSCDPMVNTCVTDALSNEGHGCGCEQLRQMVNGKDQFSGCSCQDDGKVPEPESPPA